jgi:hypothetical protein
MNAQEFQDRISSVCEKLRLGQSLDEEETLLILFAQLMEEERNECQTNRSP